MFVHTCTCVCLFFCLCACVRACTRVHLHVCTVCVSLYVLVVYMYVFVCVYFACALDSINCRLEKEIKKLEADIAQEKQAAEGLMTQMVVPIIDESSSTD